MTSKAFGLAQLGNAFADGALSNRNKIINGAFQVAQRGTSFSGLSSDQYTLDRWTSSSAGGVSLSVSQQASTATENGYFASQHFARYQRNAVLSGFVQKVENLQQFNNKTFTLTFWARSSDAATNVTLTTYTVNDGSSFNAYVTKTDVLNPTLSATWQKYEFRLAFQDMYTYGFSGSHHLRLQFFDGANAATFDLAEVQLEAGDTATPFEHRSYGQELALCQRYYEEWQGAAGDMIGPVGQAFNSSSGETALLFMVEKRAAPTISTSGSFQVWLGSGVAGIGSIGFAETRTKQSTWQYGGAGAGSVGQAIQFYSSSGTSKVMISAEL